MYGIFWLLTELSGARDYFLSWDLFLFIILLSWTLIKIQFTISDSSSSWAKLYIIEHNYCVIRLYPSFDWQYVCAHAFPGRFHAISLVMLS
jgi:hypothetical protein